MVENTSEAARQDGPPESRRNFAIEVAAVVLGGIASLGPALIGLFAFFDPLGRKKQLPTEYRRAGSTAPDGYYHVASLAALTPGGPPQRFPVIADTLDGWNISPDQPIGAVYIERRADDQLRVFNVTCPHAGCSVACDGAAFHCPCHNSSFSLDGSKLESTAGSENPSPRSLDTLAVDAELLKSGEIWVEFLNFYTGQEQKKPKL